MRIIAGEFKGRKLLPPEGDVTRPITDRVKQSLFDILSPRIEDAVVLDLFAGTGSAGLECLSRGAKEVRFFEADRSASTRLATNLRTLGIRPPRALIHAVDLFRWYDRLEKQAQATTPDDFPPADLIFLDPPYRYLRERAAELQKLAKQLSSLACHDQSIVIFRHDAADALELAPFKPYDSREYGGMILEFLTRA